MSIEIYKYAVAHKPYLFEPKVDKTPGHGPNGDCWLWTGCKDPAGYGKMCCMNPYEKAKMLSSHRFSYLYYKGDIPEGLFVCHTCDNRVCVNPDHLWLGTNDDNARDKISKNRHHLHKLRRLTNSQVKEIREKSHLSSCKLGKIYNCDHKTIENIWKMVTYKDI